MTFYEEITTNVFIRLEGHHMAKKIDAISCYQSQRGRPYASRDFLLGLARTRGVQIGSDMAECYESLRWVL